MTQEAMSMRASLLHQAPTRSERFVGTIETEHEPEADSIEGRDDVGEHPRCLGLQPGKNVLIRRHGESGRSRGRAVRSRP